MSVTIYQSKPDGFISQVSIAAAWLTFKGNYLFLQKNAKSQEAFCWGVPGGKLELQESPLDALQRELYEETKLILTSSDLVHVTNCFISKPGWNYTYHMFYHPFSAEPIIELSPEHHAYKWVSIDEMQTLPLILGTQETLDIFRQEAKNLGIT